MEMIAIEDIAIGQDITPPLRPIAVVLSDSALSSLCSACFSTLPPQPFPPFSPDFPQNPYHVPTDTPTLPLYCSPDCSSYDSPLHLSSGEAHLLSLFTQSPPYTWNDSSDLRLSLHLLSVFRKFPQKYSFLPSSSITSDQSLIFRGNKDYPFQEIEIVENPADYPENNRKPCENSHENNEIILERIREGATMLAKARRTCLDEDKRRGYTFFRFYP